MKSPPMARLEGGVGREWDPGRSPSVCYGNGRGLYVLEDGLFVEDDGSFDGTLVKEVFQFDGAAV